MLNFDLAMVSWHAWDRSAWWLLIEVATSSWHALERHQTTLD